MKNKTLNYMNQLHCSRRKFISDTGSVIIGSVLLHPAITFSNVFNSAPVTDVEQVPSDLQHIVAASRNNRFFAWPANNGMWTWDDGHEILAGYTDGPWVEQEGHNIGHPQLSRLVRSTDGGKTWSIEHPENYVGTDGEPESSPGNFKFDHHGFAMRVAATGYHGTDDPAARFFVTFDRGKTWQGSYLFNGLLNDKNLQGLEITARTNYLVTGPESCQIFMAARNPELEFAGRLDKPFLVETHDGGKTFKFVSWITPWTDQYRSVMPSAVITHDGRIVVATRRRNPRDINQPCWVDCFISADNGRKWSFHSKVGETGVNNGNPPGLTVLNDGRLACVYGNRTTRKMIVRFSNDSGLTWGEEIVIRDNPLNHDIGYPQITQNSNGKLVALYYIATENRPHSYIEASVWTP